MNSFSNIKIPKRFQRSIRIDTDFEDNNVLSSYVNSATSNRALKELCNHISTSGQCAFTWTGPYGSGKSSLAVMLNALLSHGKSNSYKIASTTLDDDTVRTVNDTFQNFKDRAIIPLVAGRESIEDQLLTQLQGKLKGKSKDIIEILKSSSKKKQIILIIDELGKALDHAARNSEDIFIMQELAELANRSEGNLIFIGILHQSFFEYANNLSINVKKEWAKIQGRFLDIPVNNSVEEQIHLLHSAIASLSKKNWKESDPNQYVSSFIKKFSKKNTWASQTILQELWPMNPVFSIALGPMTKKSFSQNQRSLFSFLNSSEISGFQSFLDKQTKGDFYGFIEFWNYLESNFSNALENSGDSHNWSLANECLTKSRELDDKLSEKIVIIISLLQIFNLKNILSTDLETICASLPLTNKKEIEKSIEKLKLAKIILFRKTDNTYVLTEGSDFDIDNELVEYLDRYKTISTEDIETLRQIRTVLAKRHYIQTGYMRYFKYKLIPFDEINKETIKNYYETIVFIFSEEKEESLKKNITKLLREINFPILVGFHKNSKILFDSLREVLALNSLLKEHQSMLIDRIARSEVKNKLRLSKLTFYKELDIAIQDAYWFYPKYDSIKVETYESNKEEKFYNKNKKFNELISNIFDDYYNQAPVIKNELTNRNKLNANGSGATRKFLNALIKKEEIKDFAIEGHPPELSIYKGILEKHNLHEIDKNNKYFISNPNKKESKEFYNLFKQTEEFVKKNDKSTFLEISKIWDMPPFGIKKALHPLLMMIFISANRKNLAVYHENVYVIEFSELLIDFVMRNLKDFSLSWVNQTSDNKELSELAKACSEVTKLPVVPTPLEIGRALKQFLKKYPDWILNTRTLSKDTLLFRDELKKANDPVDFVTKQIPLIFNKDTILDFNKFKKSLSEISNAFNKLLTELKDLIHENFKINDDDEGFTILKERASVIKDKTGDFELNAIILRLMTYDGSEKTLQELLTVIAKKSITKINDHDIEKIKIDIASIAKSFLKAEAFIAVDKRKKNMTAFSLIHGNATGEKARSFDFILSKREDKKAETLAHDLEGVIKDHQGLFASDEVTLGAIAKIIEKRMEKK